MRSLSFGQSHTRGGSGGGLGFAQDLALKLARGHARAANMQTDKIKGGPLFVPEAGTA